MTTSDEESFDTDTKWYAVIPDGHLNLPSPFIEGRIDSPFGDGSKYRKYLAHLLEHLQDLNEEGSLNGTIILGDFFDSLQKEGLNELHRIARGVRNGEYWAAEMWEDGEIRGEKISDIWDSYTKIVALMKHDSVSYVIGNHEDPRKLQEAGIEYVDFFEDEYFRFVHGDDDDTPLRLLGMSADGIVSRFLRSEMPPSSKSKIARSGLSLIKFFTRAYGFAAVHANEFFKDATRSVNRGEDWAILEDMVSDRTDQKYKYSGSGYELAKQTHLMKKERRRTDKFLVMAHEHRPQPMADGGIFLGDLYQYGTSFVGYNPREDKFYALFGIVGPKDVFSKEECAEYLMPGEGEPVKVFDVGHLWEYSPDSRRWIFKRQVQGDQYLSIISPGQPTPSESEELRGLSQTVQVSGLQEYQNLQDPA